MRSVDKIRLFIKMKTRKWEKRMNKKKSSRAFSFLFCRCVYCRSHCRCAVCVLSKFKWYCEIGPVFVSFPVVFVFAFSLVCFFFSFGSVSIRLVLFEIRFIRSCMEFRCFLSSWCVYRVCVCVCSKSAAIISTAMFWIAFEIVVGGRQAGTKAKVSLARFKLMNCFGWRLSWLTKS